MVFVPIALVKGGGVDPGSLVVLRSFFGGMLLMSLAMALIVLDVVRRASGGRPPPLRMTHGLFVFLTGATIGYINAAILVLEAVRP